LDKKIESAIKALNKHGFHAEFVADAESAKKKILARIPKDAKVGIPGSKTIRQLGLDKALLERGTIIFDHWQAGLSEEEVLKMRKAQLRSDVLLSSANAITETGELYNMDGVGNRIAPMIFGPELVIIVAGVNKLVPDLQAARERLQKIAAPRRAAELELKVNCAVTGECDDCNSPGRICRAELILHRQPALTEYEIYIVGQELGN
jgi:L-lactate utilization protein LutB